MPHVGSLLEGQEAGPAHQLMDIFQSVVISKWCNLGFAHSPFTVAWRSEGWTNISPWEYFFQLGIGHPALIRRMASRMQTVVEVWDARDAEHGDHCHSVVIQPRRDAQGARRQIMQAVANLHENGDLVFRHSARFCAPATLYDLEREQVAPAGLSAKVREWFIRKYRDSHRARHGEEASWRTGSYFKGNEFAIAAIARYGGGHNRLWRHKKIHDEEGFDHRWLPSEYNINILNRLQAEFPSARSIIFTEGPLHLPELIPFVESGFEIHVCDHEFPDLFRVFHSLASANLIIDGNSGFGAMAGYLGNTPLIQPTHTTLPIPHSVLAEFKTGNFDMDYLKKRLEEHEI